MNIAENILKHSLQNVYFLTGTACGGKTTMAKALSKKHGFIHFSDNWHEDNFKVWQSLIDEKYQPISGKKENATDWEAYFGRTVEEFLDDKKNNNGNREQLEFSIIEIIKLAQNNKVVADIWFDTDDDMRLLAEISDYNRIACLLAPAKLIIRDYYDRADHIEFTECIKSLKDPEKKFETQNELWRIHAKEEAEIAKKYNFFTITRTEESTVEKTLKILEEHFRLNCMCVTEI